MLTCEGQLFTVPRINLNTCHAHYINSHILEYDHFTRHTRSSLVGHNNVVVIVAEETGFRLQMAPCELVSPETCQSSLVEPKSSAAERASGKCLGAERQTRTDRQRLLGSCLRQGRCHRRHTDDTARVLDGKNNLYLYFIITNAFCKSGLIGLSSFRRASF